MICMWYWIFGEQGMAQWWERSPSTNVAGFNSRHRRHMWVEFVVGSLSWSDRFFSRHSHFLLSSKTNQIPIQSGTHGRGGSRIFFRRGCTRVLLYFNTNKPHSFFFFCRIPVVLENRRSSRGGGGGGAPPPPPPHTPPPPPPPAPSP